jgi:hypothetical protein
LDIEESPTVASSENVRFVPTFKIYKNGVRVKGFGFSHPLLKKKKNRERRRTVGFAVEKYHNSNKLTTTQTNTKGFAVEK